MNLLSSVFNHVLITLLGKTLLSNSIIGVIVLYAHTFCSSWQVIPYSQYSLSVVAKVTVFNLALNQTWVGLLVLVVTAQPCHAHRISPVLSAIAGFAGGFFVPPRLMPSW